MDRFVGLYDPDGGAASISVGATKKPSTEGFFIAATLFIQRARLQITMKMPLSKLTQYFVVEKLIYHSVDLSLYMVSAIVEGTEYYIVDNRGAFLKSSKLLELQKALRKVSAEKTVLRHTSPYDEMVGGPDKTHSNALEVPLADNQLS